MKLETALKSALEKARKSGIPYVAVRENMDDPQSWGIQTSGSYEAEGAVEMAYVVYPDGEYCRAD